MVKEPREQVPSTTNDLVTVEDEPSDKARLKTVDVSNNHKSKVIGQEEGKAMETSENSVQLVKATETSENSV
ncbi:hypothetical protein OIU76_003263 [Salix suchowensis]|nr:hypothetical protein OIU76_003263 [Salix suchowensis]